MYREQLEKHIINNNRRNVKFEPLNNNDTKVFSFGLDFYDDPRIRHDAIEYISPLTFEVTCWGIFLTSDSNLWSYHDSLLNTFIRNVIKT